MSNTGESNLHSALKDRVRYNTITCLYEIEEKGIKYGMTFSEFQFFKKHFAKHTLISKDSIEQWYNQLDGETKKTISVSGNIRSDSGGFYPDVEYD
jgi:hypothetical protein